MKYEEISQRDPQELGKDIDSGNSDLANKAMFDYLVSAKNFHELLDIYLKHMKNTVSWLQELPLFALDILLKEHLPVWRIAMSGF